MKALVLHSGGLDSTTCLRMALNSGREVVSLGIDYGQRHRIELEYATHQCKKWQVERRVIKVQWDKPIRPIPVGRTLEQMRESVSPAFLPGRNIVFLALAAAEAAGLGADEVWLGVNAVDFSGYPDCRPSFMTSFSQMIAEGFVIGPTIVTPLISMSKPEIAKAASDLGLDRGSTWSCYQPSFDPIGVIPCGTCDACVLHKHAWDTLDVAQS